MRLPLTKLENIALTIITILRMLSPLCLILLIRPGGYIVTFCSFYFYNLIEKLTAFLQFQEFSLRNQPVVSSTIAARRSPHISEANPKIGNILVKVEVLRIILNIDGAPVSSRSHTHTSHSQNSILLTSSLSLGVPVPRTTQFNRGV
jgi:hypothetical protein